jgi:hypothetical protein
VEKRGSCFAAVVVVYLGWVWETSSVSGSLASGKNSAFADFGSDFETWALVSWNSVFANWALAKNCAFEGAWVRNCASVRMAWGSIAFADWTETWVWGRGWNASAACSCSEYQMAEN